MSTTTPRCSDITVEPLAGTAKTGRKFVILEHAGPWSRDVLDGGTFGPELNGRIKAHLKQEGFGLQLVRQPGRSGRTIGRCNLYLVFSDEGIIEHTLVDGPEDLLELDLSAPGRNGGEVLDHPLLLICTHSKRDVCCAVKGRPLAAAMVERFPEHHVWESSHTKGHRFAPSMLLMPWNYSFGRMNVEATAAMMEAAYRGEMFLPGNRGRGTLGSRSQVAELAVAALLIDAAESPAEPAPAGGFEVVDKQDDEVVTVTHPDGRTWAVELEKQTVEGVISSCGDAPKTGSAWVAVAVAVARSVTETHK